MTTAKGPVRNLERFAHSLLEFVHDRVFVAIEALDASAESS
jgi:hypothetical protein